MNGKMNAWLCVTHTGRDAQEPKRKAATKKTVPPSINAGARCYVMTTERKIHPSVKCTEEIY